MFYDYLNLTSPSPDSISVGSGVVALLFSKFLNEKIGRKMTLIVATILQVISTCCVYFCNSFLSLAIMIGLANFYSAMLTVPGEVLLAADSSTFLLNLLLVRLF